MVILFSILYYFSGNRCFFLCIAISYSFYKLPSYPGSTVSIQETALIPENTSGQICIVLERVGNGLERDVSVTLATTAETAGNYYDNMGILSQFSTVSPFVL